MYILNVQRFDLAAFKALAQRLRTPKISSLARSNTTNFIQVEARHLSSVSISMCLDLKLWPLIYLIDHHRYRSVREALIE